jgi:hypothetical protein
MKFCNSPFLLAFALILTSPLMSQASACSNSTIRGSYAFTIHGTIFLPTGSTLLIDGIAKESFDGKGNETQLTRSLRTACSRPGGARVRAAIP